jgi:hypothetical protein
MRSDEEIEILGRASVFTSVYVFISLSICPSIHSPFMHTLSLPGDTFAMESML